MHQLASALAGGNGKAWPIRRRNRHRRNVIGFVLDPSQHSTKLDRNARARLIHQAETMERATKAWGRRNGIVSRIALDVLRALLLKFHNPESGLCCPSIETLAKATGLCRASIINALQRLEALGVLVVTRRLVRVRDGSGVSMCRQGSNLYSFRELPRLTTLPKLPKAKQRRGFLARVYGMSGNHNTHQPTNAILPAEGVSEDGLSGVNVPPRGSSDWRTRARMAFRRQS